MLVVRWSSVSRASCSTVLHFPTNVMLSFPSTLPRCAPTLVQALSAELGSMGSREGGDPDAGSTAEEAGAIYTDPDQARDFVESTGLDILACSFGTVHGLYKGEPHLNIDVLTDIRSCVNVPLVMHGAPVFPTRITLVPSMPASARLTTTRMALNMPAMPCAPWLMKRLRDIRMLRSIGTI